MTIAINIRNYAVVDINQVDTLSPSVDWVVDPQFDDPIRAFEVGPKHWVITGNTVHVMTDLEIDTEPTALAAAISERRAEVNAKREAMFYAGFVDTNGVRWSSTPVDIANINAVCTLIAVGAVTTTQTWRDYDNIDHQLTPTELIGLAAQMATFGKTCYAVAWEHKSNIDLMTKISDVIAYNIDINWPT